MQITDKKIKPCLMNIVGYKMILAMGPGQGVKQGVRILTLEGEQVGLRLQDKRYAAKPVHKSSKRMRKTKYKINTNTKREINKLAETMKAIIIFSPYSSFKSHGS